MPFRIDTRQCRYSLHGLDVTHFWPDDSIKLDEGPIIVRRLDNGDVFVEDGRHRLIRALLKGQGYIEAEWYEDHVAAQEAEKVKKAILIHTNIGQNDDIDVATVRKNAGFPVFHHPVGANYTPMVGPPPHDVVLFRDGSVWHGDIELTFIPPTMKSACGRNYWHQKHDFGEHMEQTCTGLPTQAGHD